MLARTLLLLALPVAAVAAEPAPADAKDRQVCFVEARTGSNIKQKVCMTEAERERRRKEDQEAMSKLKTSTAGAGARKTGAER